MIEEATEIEDQSPQPKYSCIPLMENPDDREKEEDELVVLVQGKIRERAGGDEEIRACIFKVAPAIRRAKPEAFTPKLIYLGLYQTNLRKHLEPEAEIGYVWKVRVARLLRDEDFKSLVDRIRNKEGEVRSCYQGQLRIQSSKCLAFSLALDALFVAAFGLRGRKNLKSGRGSIASFLQAAFVDLTRSHKSDVYRDMLLLENQIPLVLIGYALESLLNGVFWFDHLTMEKKQETILRISFSLSVAKHPFGNRNSAVSPPSSEPGSEIRGHLLSLLYKSCASPPASVEKRNGGAWAMIGGKIRTISAALIGENIRTASLTIWAIIKEKLSPVSSASALDIHILSTSQLRRAGIRFKKEDIRNCRGISFDKRSATLHLPIITVEDSTDSLVRNLLAYEQHFNQESSVFHSYVSFMDHLIDTSNDVDELVKTGILRNFLGSGEEVAHTWNNITEGLTQKYAFRQADNPFHLVASDLHNYCQARRHRWVASFKETYMEKSPWLLVSIVVGAILLVLTLLQTYYTIVGYYDSKMP